MLEYGLLRPTTGHKLALLQVMYYLIIGGPSTELRQPITVSEGANYLICGLRNSGLNTVFYSNTWN